MPELAKTKALHLVRPAAGGLREHVIDLCARLAQGGHDVMVAGALDPTFRRRWTNAEGRWANVGFPRSLRWRPNRAAVRTFARLFGSQQPDLVHAHGYHAALLAALAVKRATPRPPLVFTAHTLPLASRRPALRRAAEWWACRHALAAAEKVITVSAAVAASSVPPPPTGASRISTPLISSTFSALGTCFRSPRWHTRMLSISMT